MKKIIGIFMIVGILFVSCLDDKGIYIPEQWNCTYMGSLCSSNDLKYWECWKMYDNFNYYETWYIDGFEIDRYWSLARMYEDCCE